MPTKKGVAVGFFINHRASVVTGNWAEIKKYSEATAFCGQSKRINTNKMSTKISYRPLTVQKPWFTANYSLSKLHFCISSQT
jgi:hypothetical protein